LTTLDAPEICVDFDGKILVLKFTQLMDASMGFCLLACSPDDAPGWRKLQNTKVMYGIKKK